MTVLVTQDLGVPESTGAGTTEDAAARENAATDGAAAERASISQIIHEKNITAQFQPIVRLDTAGDIVGFEAFARGPDGELSEPEPMLAAAARAGLTGELDRVAHAAACRAALQARMHPALPLFINASPVTLGRVDMDALAPSIAQAIMRLQLFADVSERTITADPQAALASVERIRSLGWGVAWDNAGANANDLALMALVRPDVVKIDMSVVHHHAHPDAGKIVNAVAAYAESTGALILAAGIETHEHLETARGMGAALGQGFYFGHPGPLPMNTGAPGEPIALIPQFVAGTTGDTPLQIFRGVRAPATAPVTMLQGLAHHLAERCLLDPEPPVILVSVPVGFSRVCSIIEMLDRFAERGSFTVMLGSNQERPEGSGVRVVSLAADDPLRDELSMVVVGPHFAALLAGRMAQGEISLGLTYDRQIVLRSAHALLARIAAA